MKLHPGETINKVKFDWLPHDDDECTICTAGRGRGRPKKKSFGGRPSALVQHIRAVSCPLPATEIHVLDTQYKEDVCCIVCKSVAVEIQPCKLLACQSCCIQLVSQKQPAFTCPGCSLSHDCADITFSSVSPFVKKIIGNLLVHCDKCSKQIKLICLNDDCATHHQTAENPSVDAALEEVIRQPLDVQPTNLEKKVATNLVTRLFHQQGDNSIKKRQSKLMSQIKQYVTCIYVQPIHLGKVPSPTVPSSQSSSDTQRRRAIQLSKIRHRISLGDVSSQMSTELRMLPSEERYQLMKEANFHITIPPEQGLAMKSVFTMAETQDNEEVHAHCTCT